MALITVVGRVTRNNIFNYEGLSTDIKPVDLGPINSGSSFYCVDNGDYYKWNNDQWYLQ